MVIVALSHMKLFPGDVNFGPNPEVAPSSYGLNAAVTPDGMTMFVTEPASNELLVVDLATRKVLMSLPTGPTPAGLSISPDGREVWVVDADLPGILSSAAEVSVISTPANGVMGTVSIGGSPIDVAFTPDGSRAYVTENGIFAPGSVAVIDAATLSTIGHLEPLPWQRTDWHPTSVAVTPDGKHVWVSSASVIGLTPTDPDFVYVFSAATGAELTRIPVGRGAFFMSLSRDGKYAYVADKESCDVKEIATAEFRVIATMRTPGADGCPYGLSATSTDGVVEAATGSNNTLGLGKQGDVLEQLDFRTSRTAVLRGVGPDPVTVTVAPSGAHAYVLDAVSPFVTVVDTRSNKILGMLDLAPSERHPSVRPKKAATPS